MKLFPTVIALVLCSCLLCNVQQSYAKSAPGEKKRKLSSRVAALEEALGAISNTTSSLSDQLASGIVKVKAIAERVNKTEALTAEVGTMKTDVGALKTEVGTMRTEVGRMKSEAGTMKNKVGAMEIKVGTLQRQLGAKRCASGRVDFSQLHNQRTIDNIRNEIKRVQFSRPFATVPVVTAAFVSLDTDADANLRARAFVENLRTSGFDVRVMEWDTTHNYQISVAWMACAS